MIHIVCVVYFLVFSIHHDSYCVCCLLLGFFFANMSSNSTLPLVAVHASETSSIVKDQRQLIPKLFGDELAGRQYS